jgi:hypothetical protein
MKSTRSSFRGTDQFELLVVCLNLLGKEHSNPLHAKSNSIEYPLPAQQSLRLT